jgi:hypothetical protein
VLHNVCYIFTERRLLHNFVFFYCRISTFFHERFSKIKYPSRWDGSENHLARSVAFVTSWHRHMQKNVARMAHNCHRFCPLLWSCFLVHQKCFSHVIIILFEMPVSMIFCSFGCVCTSALTCALLLSSCSCGVETSCIFKFFNLFSSPFHSQEPLESWVLYKFYFSRENFKCGIDDVSVGNMTRVSDCVILTFRRDVDSWPLKQMGPIGCPETSVRNYHYTRCNNREERRSHLRQ